MNSKLNVVVAFMLLVSMFACSDAKVKKETKENKSGYTVTGFLEGAKDAKIVIRGLGMESFIDSAMIKDGKFILKGDCPIPQQCHITIEAYNAYNVLYIENSEMTWTGHIDDHYNMVVKGCKAQDEYNEYNKLRAPIDEKYNPIYGELRKPDLTKERKAELEKELEVRAEKMKAISNQFMKKYPQSAHTANIISGMIMGKNAIETQEIIRDLDANVQKNSGVVKMLAMAVEKAAYEVGVEKLLANVKNVAYKVDSKFEGKNLKDVVYLGMMNDNNVCALKKDGTVQIITPKGKVASSFKPELNGKASSVAVDVNNDIYLMSNVMEKVVKKVRGRSIERMNPKSVECYVFSPKGDKKAQFECKGIITASGARIVDNKLALSDCRSGKIAMFDKTDGKAGNVIENLRPCCGILDFSVNEKKEILVADLGAFRVQGFDYSGKKMIAFGQRGKALDNFHGCCNPVGVTNLSTGAIVTVEKDPTRVKIYSQEGAKQIAGIEELVKGCNYIPMIVDANDNLYLASGAKGVVKCVSVN